MGFDFIKAFIPGKVYVSDPTWGNHQAVITKAGLEWGYYSYYDPKTRGLNFEGMMADLKKMEPGSVVLLHPCAHNPTGVDPNLDQWK